VKGRRDSVWKGDLKYTARAVVIPEIRALVERLSRFLGKRYAN